MVVQRQQNGKAHIARSKNGFKGIQRAAILAGRIISIRCRAHAVVGNV